MKPRIALPRTAAERRAAITSGLLLALSVAIIAAIVLPVRWPWSAKPEAVAAAGPRATARRPVPRRPHLARRRGAGAPVQSLASPLAPGHSPGPAALPVTPASLVAPTPGSR